MERRAIICEPLSDTAAIIAPRSFWVENPWVVAEGDRGSVLVPVVPSDHPDVSLPAGFYATKKLSSIIGGDVRVEEVPRRMFVYGTLLSRHWSGRRVLGSWLQPSDYRVRARLDGFSLSPLGPCAFRDSGGSLIGELYFGVPEDAEARIDSVELSCGYSKRRVVVEIIENAPVKSSSRAWAYICPERYSEKVPTMLYGESFKTVGGLVVWERGEYFDVLRGNAPIVISAPHGGYLRVGKPLRREVADMETFELSERLVTAVYELSGRKMVPSCILARLHRSRADFNRPPEYSGVWRRAVGKYQQRLIEMLREGGIFLDVHGMRRADVDIVLGTLRGASAEKWLISELRHSLERFFTVEVDGTFPGGWLTRLAAKRTNAFQLELSRRLRSLNSLTQTANRLAKAVWEVSQKLVGGG